MCPYLYKGGRGVVSSPSFAHSCYTYLDDQTRKDSRREVSTRECAPLFIARRPSRQRTPSLPPPSQCSLESSAPRAASSSRQDYVHERQPLPTDVRTRGGLNWRMPATLLSFRPRRPWECPLLGSDPVQCVAYAAGVVGALCAPHSGRRRDQATWIRASERRAVLDQCLRDSCTLDDVASISTISLTLRAILFPRTRAGLPGLPLAAFSSSAFYPPHLFVVRARAAPQAQWRLRRRRR
jgi:hypothetical protein